MNINVYILLDAILLCMHTYTFKIQTHNIILHECLSIHCCHGNPLFIVYLNERGKGVLHHRLYIYRLMTLLSRDNVSQKETRGVIELRRIIRHFLKRI